MTNKRGNCGWAGRARRAVEELLTAGALILPLMGATAAQAQNYHVLHSFANDATDGGLPTAGVVRDPSGNLYGTTLAGGVSGAGTVFMITPTGREVVLYEFTGGADGSEPYGGLVRDQAGNLYGTTFYGGTGKLCETLGCGTVFKLDTTQTETVLYSFTGGTDGAEPAAGLLLDASDNVYGTTEFGGAHDAGTVFEVSSSGKERVLYSFSGGVDGGYPQAVLVRDASGNLYGTTYIGGGTSCSMTLGSGCGTVFRVSGLGKETVLYSFAGGVDGKWPAAGVIRDAVGNLYGTTTSGGADGYGTVFKLDTSGGEMLIHSFADGTDGATPYGGVILDASGNLYGTASESNGASSSGTAFKLDTSGVLTVLYSFGSKKNGRDGDTPADSLLLGPTGTLYGTTARGGAHAAGVVFEIIPQ
jgi:uncharacterized repeat protein (TIGR03803 family)